MAFQRPTLSELVERIQADMVSRLQLAGAVLRRSVLHVLSRVIAGASHMLHGHIDYLGDQLFADSADAEHLRRQAGMYGIFPRPAAFAEGAVTLTGANGTAVPAGTVLVRSDGAEYETQAEVTVSGGSAAPVIEARVAGAAGNTPAGASLSLASPIPGVSTSATVGTGGLTLGADEEGTESLRARFLARLREAPQGGNAADYVAWSLEVPGVSRVWVRPHGDGVGSVVVLFMLDSGIPDLPSVNALQSHLEERRPVTAMVRAAAPYVKPVNVTVGIRPLNTTTQAAVRAELEDLIAREAEPGKKLLHSQLLAAIAAAPGLEDFALTAPVADVTVSPVEIAQLGSLTFTGVV